MRPYRPINFDEFVDWLDTIELYFPAFITWKSRLPEGKWQQLQGFWYKTLLERGIQMSALQGILRRLTEGDLAGEFRPDDLFPLIIRQCRPHIVCEWWKEFGDGGPCPTTILDDDLREVAMKNLGQLVYEDYKRREASLRPVRKPEPDLRAIHTEPLPQMTPEELKAAMEPHAEAHRMLRHLRGSDG